MADKKRYRSALRTERLLREAYVSLAQKGERLSVAALCREADLNRTTFYTHYNNVEELEADLTGGLMTGLGDVVSAALGDDGQLDPALVVEAVGSYVEKNRPLLRLLLTSAGSFEFGDELRTSLLKAVGGSELAAMVRFDYVAGALASVYRTWVLGQYGDVPVADINRAVVQLVV